MPSTSQAGEVNERAAKAGNGTTGQRVHKTDANLEVFVAVAWQQADGAIVQLDQVLPAVNLALAQRNVSETRARQDSAQIRTSMRGRGTADN